VPKRIAAPRCGERVGPGVSANEARVRVAYYFAYPNTLAGAARSCFELITHLPPAVQPVVIVPSDGRVAARCRDQGIECHIVSAGPALMTFGKGALAWSPLRRVWVSCRELAPYTARLAFELRRRRVDIVHANDSRGALLIGPAARLLRLPLVSHVRGRKAYSGVYWRAFEALSTRIITVCEALQADISPGARCKASTVYNGTEDLRRSRLHALSSPRPLRWLEHLRAQGHLVVSCFASVIPFKGYHHLIDAIALLARTRSPKAIFLGIGEVPESAREYERFLYERMRSLGVDNLTLAGWQDDPLAFYSHTDIAVLPSVAQETLQLGDRVLQVEGNEGFPRTHLEAMSLGLPVVGTDIAGVREQVLDGVTGLVVPPGRPDALAGALARLLADAGLRQRMGAAGRQRVLERFSTERCVQGTLAVYRSLVQAGRWAEAEQA
jgi:glycosyltransferase involved in cell wall biosynthesis